MNYKTTNFTIHDWDELKNINLSTAQLIKAAQPTKLLLFENTNNDFGSSIVSSYKSKEASKEIFSMSCQIEARDVEGSRENSLRNAIFKSIRTDQKNRHLDDESLKQKQQSEYHSCITSNNN